MITVNKFEKKYKCESSDIIKYHLIHEIFFIRKQEIINSDLEILAYLIQSGPIDLRNFCYKAARVFYDVPAEEYSVKEQNIRNRIVKLEKRGFIIKKKKHNKIITIAPDLNVNIKPPFLLQYSLVKI